MPLKHRICAAFVFAGCLCASSAAQNAAPQTPDPGTGTSAQVTGAPPKAAQESAQQAEEPISLGEAARLARANKPAPVKAAKNYDDDNFPRSAPIVKKKSAENAASNPSIDALPEEEMRGKVVLLDFWASWCGPCRAGLPNLKRLQSIYAGEDFEIISVSEDEDQATWSAFVTSHQMTWTQRFDGSSALMQRFQVNGLPTYILLGRDGREIQRYVGEDPGRTILERIGPELKNAMAARL
jgi:thiol-disulfide isomerase/thioredoxin